MVKNKNINEDDVSIGTSNVTNIGGDTSKTAVPNKPAPPTNKPVEKAPPTGQVGYSSLNDEKPQQSDGKSPTSVKSANANKVAPAAANAAAPVPVKEETGELPDGSGFTTLTMKESEVPVTDKTQELINNLQKTIVGWEKGEIHDYAELKRLYGDAHANEVRTDKLPTLKKKLANITFIRDALVPYQKSEYKDFNSYYRSVESNGSAQQELNNLVKAANLDDYTYNEILNTITSQKASSSVKETEMPIKEELASSDKNEMYVEYLKDMQGEEPFMNGDKKYQYVWAKYPDGKKDVGVYAYQGDVTYSNDYFRKTILNLKEAESELKGGYVKSKLKEDAFSSTNTATSNNTSVATGLGTNDSGLVKKLFDKILRNPDIVTSLKAIRTPSDKQIAAVEFDKMLNLPAASVPRVAKELNTMAKQDIPNANKPADPTKVESVNPKMNKASIVEFISKTNPKRVVKTKLKIKNLK